MSFQRQTVIDLQFNERDIFPYIQRRFSMTRSGKITPHWASVAAEIRLIGHKNQWKRERSINSQFHDFPFFAFNRLACWSSRRNQVRVLWKRREFKYWNYYHVWRIYRTYSTSKRRKETPKKLLWSSQESEHTQESRQPSTSVGRSQKLLRWNYAAPLGDVNGDLCDRGRQQLTSTAF